jgi:hypothetical protein
MDITEDTLLSAMATSPPVAIQGTGFFKSSIHLRLILER